MKTIRSTSGAAEAAASARPSGRPLIARVIEGGFCIGCGACAAIDPAFRVRPQADGALRVDAVPDLPRETLARAGRVCPFADAPDEDALAARALPDAEGHRDGIGRYSSLHAGWADATRPQASSGGLTRWLLSEMLRTGEIDFVLSVDGRMRPEGAPGAPLFSYRVHERAEEYLSGASSSAYHPVTLAGLIEEAEARSGPFAVTALPCFARALRALAEERPALKERMRLVSGVICGGLKTVRYAEDLAGQMGVGADALRRIDFRDKSVAQVASEKGVAVWTGEAGPPDAVRRVQDLKGTNYGLGYFKPKACDYCDDVMAETADIAFGDAWIEPYRSDPAGTNVVVVRDPALTARLRAAAGEGRIRLDDLDEDRVIATQAGGLRHRRDGLRVRLAARRLLGRWSPRKRVSPAWGGAGWGGPALWAVQAARTGIRAATTGRRWPPGPGGRMLMAASWRLMRYGRRLFGPVRSRWGA